MTIESFSPEVLPLTARTLLGISVLLLMCWIGTAVFRRSSAAFKHRVWSLGLLSCLAVPLAIVSAPDWQMEWWSIDHLAIVESGEMVVHAPAELEETAAATSPPPAEQDSPADERREPEPETPLILSDFESEEIGSSPERDIPRDTDFTGISTPAAKSSSRLVVVWLTLLWITGAALALLRIVRSLRLSRRVCSGSRAVTEPSCRELLQQLAHQLRLTRLPRLLESERITSPVCVGLRRSAILLPFAWRNWEREELRSVLLHELGHLQRRDVGWQLLASVASSVYWFHPLVWLGAWRMKVEREFACDDLVVHHGEPPADYARLLLTLAEQLNRQEQLNYGACAVGMARNPKLESRIRAVLQPDRNRRPLSNRLAWMSALTAVLLVAVTGVLNPLFSVGPEDTTPSREKDGVTSTTTSLQQDSDLMALPERALFELGNPLLHQRGHVDVVEFSPDGKYVATGSLNSDSAIRVWDVSTGKLFRRLVVPDGSWGSATTALQFTPAGKQLLAGHRNGRLEVWNVETGKRVSEIERHKGEIQAMALSPDGTRLATGGQDGTIRISPIDALDQVALYSSSEKVPGRGGAIIGQYGLTSLQYTPDGRHLVAGLSKSYKILILNAAEAKLIRSIDFKEEIGPQGSFSSGELKTVHLSSDGKQIIASYYRYVPRYDLPETIVSYSKNVQISEVGVWDFETGQKIKELRPDQHDVGFSYSALSPDGKTLALGLQNQILLIDAKTGTTIRSIPVPGWWGDSVQFSPDGQLVSAGVRKTIGLWQRETGERLFSERPGHHSTVDAVAYSPDGQLVATTGDNRFHVWKAETGKHVFSRTLGPDSHLWDIVFSEDSQSIGICGAATDQRGRDFGTAVVWGIDGFEKASVELPRRGEKVALSPDGKRLVVAHSGGSFGDTRLELWDFSRRWLRLAEYPRDPQKGLRNCVCLKFSADARYILIAEGGGTVIKWDTTGEDADISFVADWRPEDRRNDKKGKYREPTMFDGDFTSDGKYLVTSAYDMHIWNVETGQLYRTIEIPTVKKWCRLKVAPDNRTIATSEIIYSGEPGTDTIRLFDLTTGEQTLTLEPNDDRAFSFAFSPDSKRLVTGLTRGTALVWDLSD